MGDGLQPFCRLWDRADAVLEHGEPLRVTETAHHRFDDVEVDAARPHAGLGALVGSGTHQGRRGVKFFQVLADRRHLGDDLSAVEFEAGHLARRVASEVGRLAVLTAHDVDLLCRDFDALFEHQDPHEAGVGSETVVELHGASGDWDR